MGFAWKFLLPLTLVNLLVAGIWTQLDAPKNYVVTISILVIALTALYWANRPEMPKKRTYRYAYADK